MRLIEALAIIIFVLWCVLPKDFFETTDHAGKRAELRVMEVARPDFERNHWPMPDRYWQLKHELEGRNR